MIKLITSKDNSKSPDSQIGTQQWGIIFWQKTGFLQHCNELGFASIVKLIDRNYSPTDIQFSGRTCLIKFSNDDKKVVHLALKQEPNSKHLFIYGEAHTASTDSKFHLFTLELICFIAKQIGTKFFVDDASGYVQHGSIEALNQFIKQTNKV